MHVINKISLENSALAFKTNKIVFAYFDKKIIIMANHPKSRLAKDMCSKIFAMVFYGISVLQTSKIR